MPDVDVVIVTYDSEDRVRRCVEPLIGAEGVRIVVVDSASNDRTLDVLRGLPVDVIPLAVNRGFGFACNAGWRAGKAEHVLFLNPDASIGRDALATLVAVAREHARAGAVAPRIVEPDGRLDYSLRRFPRLRSTYAQALFLHRLAPAASWSDESVRDARVYEAPGVPESASGACLLFKRTVLDRLGGFDDQFFLYCEELDLCKRLRDAGLVLRYEPGATAVHEGGASAPRSHLLPVLAASRVRYARKHEPRAVVLLERLGIALGAVTHALVGRGGVAARKGHLRALLRALSPNPRPGPR